MVDVGGGTIDFLAAYDKVPNYGRSGAHPESMMACAYEVAKAINPELKNQYGVIQAIDLAIRDNRETTKWPDTGVPSTRSCAGVTRQC